MVTLNIGSNVQSFNYAVSDSTGVVASGSTTTGTTTAQVPSGLYSLDLTNDNGNNIYTTTVNTNISPNIFAPVVAPTDPNTVGVSSTPLVNGQYQTSSNSTINVMTPNNITSEEFIPPNSNFGAYFTCEDARLYVGDVFIDEGIYVQYTLQDNKIPLYGYRSRFYDALAQGKSIVQGQIGLNFVSEGYLSTVLKEYNSLSSGSPSSDQLTLNGLVYTQQQLTIMQATANTASAANASQLQLITQQVQQLVTKLGPSSLTAAQAYLSAANTPAPIAGKSYTNALYADVPFDLVIQLNGAARTAIRRLEGCVLIANDQVIDSSGNTLSDGYSFIARRLR